jgi:hypothetical protein
VCLERGAIVGAVAAGENPRVKCGVERLDAPVHHLGESGDLGDAGDGEAGVSERAGRAAGRHELEAALRESAAQGDDAVLV